MNWLEYLSPQPPAGEIPRRMNDPFAHAPHALALKASKCLQTRIAATANFHRLLHEEDGGKMFGVLVVQDHVGRVGYLGAFSGQLDRQWCQPGFVPPVFDEVRQQRFLQQGEAQLAQISAQLTALEQHPLRLQMQQRLRQGTQQAQCELEALKQQHQANKHLRAQQRAQSPDYKQLEKLSKRSQQDKRAAKQLKKHWQQILDPLQQQLDERFDLPISELKKQRKRLSHKLHMQVFEGYELYNFKGQLRPLRSFYQHRQPAGGSGDCAAPKLLQFAARHGLKPLALAEFWYGAPAAGSVRRHGCFYPPCRGKCQPILPFMLQGVDVRKVVPTSGYAKLKPAIVYEDDALLVLNKPPGLLSTPGKQQSWSVQSWIQQHYPQARGGLLVHRLDMATSGLILAAKTPRAHKKLQQQFIARSIDKRYLAVLSRVLEQDHYEIDLPMRVDLDDRPRQQLCERYGKPALTRVEVIARGATTSRVYFYPHTGRTHQLRIHAAHQRGLNAPIVGDELYGVPARRLCLHAESLRFEHPHTGATMQFQVEAEF